ncbi:MAG: hypothetical protein ABTQ32_21250 [Myxococcaceae bacterium]
MRLRLAVFSAMAWLACDFDAAYSERCDAGLCGGEAGGAVAGGSAAGGSVAGGSVAGGSAAGGSVAGGSVAGGSAAGGSVAGGSVAGGSVAGGSVPGGSVAGGSVAGGSAVDAGCTLSVLLPSAPAPGCVPIELAYLCDGNATAASVALQSSYQSMPTVGAGTFFASPNCTGSPVASVVSPANFSFRPALANGRPLVGDWLLTASTNGVSVPTLLVLGAQVTAPTTRLQVGVCTPLATPSLTGLMSLTPVAFWQDVVVDGFTLPSMLSFCGPSAVTIPASMASPTVPSIAASRVWPGTVNLTGFSQNPAALVTTSTFPLTTCMADGGAVPTPTECCGGFVVLSDGGIACP